MKPFYLLSLSLLLIHTAIKAQTPLITDIAARKIISLNGAWQYIIDPYGTGFYDYRYQEIKVNDREAFWNSDVQTNKTDRRVYQFTDKYTLQVPSDWNSPV